MNALEEAVNINQLHNRDPVGGSNENLFLYVIFDVTNYKGTSYIICVSDVI